MTAPQLAFDFSSRRLSAALQSGGALHTAHCVLERFDGVAAVALIEGLFKEANLGLAEVGEICIGVGPGNFSGIRLSLAWAFGAAAPGGIRIRTHASIDLLSARLLADGRRDFAVLGDARRGLWWGRVVTDGCPGGLRSLPPGEWAGLTEGLACFSPDVARLPGHPQLREIYPEAADFLRLSLSEVPPVPIYLHAAVAD